MKKKLSAKQKKDAIFIYGFLAWPILHFVVFWIGMNFRTFYDSFFDISIVEGAGVVYQWDNFDNYIRVFKIIFNKAPYDNYDLAGIINYRAVTNSLSLIPLALFINMPLTILFAYGIFKKVPMYGFFRIALFLPSLVSSVVLCMCFQMAIDINRGILPEILRWFGLTGARGDPANMGIIPQGGFLADPKTCWPMILVFSVINGVSGNLIYFTSTMARLPASVFESAELDGASSLRQFVSIVVPMIWPTITTMTVTLVAAVFTWIMPSLLMTDGGQWYSTTIGLMITQVVKNDMYNTVMSAFGVIVAIFGTIIIVSIKTGMEKLFEGVEY